MPQRLDRLSRLRRSQIAAVLARLLVLVVLPNLSHTGIFRSSHLDALEAASVVRFDCLDVHGEHFTYDPRPHYCRVALDGNGAMNVQSVLADMSSNYDIQHDSECKSVSDYLGDMSGFGMIGEWTGWGDDGGAFTDLGTGASFFWSEYLSNDNILFHEGYHASTLSNDENEAEYYQTRWGGVIVY